MDGLLSHFSLTHLWFFILISNITPKLTLMQLILLNVKLIFIFKYYCPLLEINGVLQRICVLRWTTIYHESWQKQGIWSVISHWKVYDKRWKHSRLFRTLLRELSMSVVSNLSEYKMRAVFKSQGRKELIASWPGWLRLCHVRDERFYATVAGILSIVDFRRLVSVVGRIAI